MGAVTVGMGQTPPAGMGQAPLARARGNRHGPNTTSASHARLACDKSHWHGPSRQQLGRLQTDLEIMSSRNGKSSKGALIKHCKITTTPAVIWIEKVGGGQMGRSFGVPAMLSNHEAASCACCCGSLQDRSMWMLWPTHMGAPCGSATLVCHGHAPFSLQAFAGQQMLS